MGTPYLSGDASVGDVANGLNNVIRENQASQVVDIFKDNTGTRRVLLGKGKDGFYGLRVSKPTFDVYDTDEANLIFNSDNNIFKIISTGTLDVAVTNGASASTTFTKTLAHGQSFRPSYLAYVTVPAGTGGQLEQVPYFFHIYDAASTSFQVRAQARCYVDDTNFVAYVTTNNGALYAGTWTFRYYLLRETAN